MTKNQKEMIESVKPPVPAKVVSLFDLQQNLVARIELPENGWWNVIVWNGRYFYYSPHGHSTKMGSAPYYRETTPVVVADSRPEIPILIRQ